MPPGHRGHHRQNHPVGKAHGCQCKQVLAPHLEGPVRHFNAVARRLQQQCASLPPDARRPAPSAPLMLSCPMCQRPRPL